MKNKIESTKKKKYISIDLLNAFTGKEIEGFSKFISYHYFNTDKILPALLIQLRKYVIAKSCNFSDYEVRIYKAIFSDLGNSIELNLKQRKRLNSKLNVLARLAEKFLCINGLDENNFCKNELLYQALLDKKQYELFNRKINSERKKIKLFKFKDSSYYYRIHKTESYILQSIHQNELMNAEDCLTKQNRNIDLFYILEKLSLYISMHTSRASANDSHNLDTIEMMWNLVNYIDYADIPLVKAYSATILLLKKQSNKTYKELIFMLDEFKDILSPDTLTILYSIALNFCAKQLKRGKFTFDDLFEIYKKLDEQNLFLVENLMPAKKLKNIITVGCRIGNFQWAQNILSKYYSFIRKPVRESVYQFNLGAIAFYQKKFDTSLQHFIKVDNVNLIYDINCRVMMLKAHFEIDEDYDERTVQIYRSTEKYFVENKSLTSYNKRAFKNFIRLLINLYRIKHQATKMNVTSFQKKLDAQELNSDKSWLKEKLKELVQKH